MGHIAAVELECLPFGSTSMEILFLHMLPNLLPFN